MKDTEWYALWAPVTLEMAASMLTEKVVGHELRDEYGATTYFTDGTALNVEERDDGLVYTGIIPPNHHGMMFYPTELLARRPAIR